MYVTTLTGVLREREKPCTKLPSLLHWAPALWYEPQNGASGIIFQLSALSPALSIGTSPFICIYSDQSEHLHKDKTECAKLTNQDSAIWTYGNYAVWIPHWHRNEPIMNQGRNYLLKKKSPSPLSLWTTPSVFARGCISTVCKLFTFLSQARLGIPVGIGLVSVSFCWQSGISEQLSQRTYCFFSYLKDPLH